jgi:hypothetical protein
MTTSRSALFWSRVEKTETCWLWRGSITPNGYGRLGKDYAHRLSYQMAKGEIPAGLDLDHLCRVRSCVNPDHLEAVTRAENLRRGDWPNSRKDSCPQGHEYNEQNTQHWGGRRYCRTCHLEHSRNSYKRRKGATK